MNIMIKHRFYKLIKMYGCDWYPKGLLLRKILRLMDHRSGHISVTDGVILALEKEFNFEIVDLKIKLRNKILLQVMKKLINYHWFDKILKNNPRYLNIFYKNFKMPKDEISLIISTGGETAYMNIWLSRIFNMPNIYCSGLRGIKPEHFYLFINTLESNLKNCIQLEIAPTKIGSKNLLHDIDRFCDKNNIDKKQKYFVLLIGGNGAGYSYTKKDFKNLVKNFMNLVIKNDAKALISTSRRTGIENEKFLHEQFSKYNEHIAYSVYFNEYPEKVVAAYLDLASILFVTEESGSMITESLFYKKPLFTLRPKNVKDQAKYKLFLNNLYTKKRMMSFSLEDDFSNVDLQRFNFSYMKKMPIDDLAEKIQPYLKEFLS